MTTLETKNIGINVLSSNVFNLDQDIVKLPWRSLSNEKRIELFNKYFETDFNNPNSYAKQMIYQFYTLFQDHLVILAEVGVR